MPVNYHTTNQGAIKIYHLEGKLVDNIKSSELQHSMKSDIETGIKNLIIDLCDLEYINSNGLNILLTILREMKASKGSICLCCANKKILDLLEITKLNTIFLNYPSLEKAVIAVSKK